jgi:hypothetical protein
MGISIPFPEPLHDLRISILDDIIFFFFQFLDSFSQVLLFFVPSSSKLLVFLGLPFLLFLLLLLLFLQPGFLSCQGLFLVFHLLGQRFKHVKLGMIFQISGLLLLGAGALSLLQGPRGGRIIVVFVILRSRPSFGDAFTSASR